MLPAQVLPVNENDIVLDTCAAPGGKSTKLATKLNHTGLLISNDISSSRCQGLLKNIELFGCDNAWVTSEDLTNMEEHYPETFDKILVDAPCSGEGMSICLNKIKGVYCAKVSNESEAILCKSHNNANVIAMSEDVDPELMKMIVNKFIETPFSNVNKYIRRNDMIKELEND